jgi:hypothetical protein
MTTALHPPPPTIHTHARAVARAVRGTFSELLLAVGANPQAPQSISRQLGLNKNLAWKIAKIVQADDPIVALEQMPGSAGIAIFLRSLHRAGADAKLLETAREAVQEYERLIEIHSGDRSTLEMMGSDLSTNGRQQRDEHHRKLLFQGASYVWGAQARVILKVGVVGPGSEAGLLDFASLNALVDFRRLRPDTTWVMATRHSDNDDGSRMATSASECIDPRFTDVDMPPFMAEFCSQPLPPLRRVVDGAWTRFELCEGPVGNTGALTCAMGAIQRRIPYYRSETNEWGVHMAKCDVPAELMVLDAYFHHDFAFAIPPEPRLYSELGASLPEPARERYRLPLNESLQDLGLGPLPPATPEVPRYSQMIHTMFERMRWNPAEFHGFRMKIVYPAYPTAIVLRYRLPEAP